MFVIFLYELYTKKLFSGNGAHSGRQYLSLCFNREFNIKLKLFFYFIVLRTMSKKATWTEKDLKAALHAVNSGKGKRASARNDGK